MDNLGRETSLVGTRKELLLFNVTANTHIERRVAASLYRAVLPLIAFTPPGRPTVRGSWRSKGRCGTNRAED
jgi:hypothetical protein